MFSFILFSLTAKFKSSAILTSFSHKQRFSNPSGAALKKKKKLPLLKTQLSLPTQMFKSADQDDSSTET